MSLKSIDNSLDTLISKYCLFMVVQLMPKLNQDNKSTSFMSI